MDIAHHTASYIQSIPEELLCLVFVEYVEGGSSPWRLTLVCHKWYNVALSCHRLWSNIQIGEAHIEKKEKKWSIPGITKPVWSMAQYQFCFLEEDLKHAIERSGKAKLVVKAWGSVLDGYTCNLMRDLLVPGVADRIWHLEIRISHGATLDKSIKLSTVFTEAPLTHLQSIDIRPLNNDQISKAILNNILNNGTQIQEARLCVSLMYSLIPTIPNSFWKPLKLLQDYTLYPSGPLTSSNVIPLCKKLESLSLKWNRQEVLPIALNDLTFLDIDTTPSHFADFTIPRLEVLRIIVQSELSHDESMDARDVAYPSLNSLEVLCSDITWMSKFHMPVLDNLRISTDFPNARGYQNFLKFFSTRSFPTIRKLEIVSTCSEEGFVSTLDAVPNVRHLIFVPRGDFDPEFGEKLFERWSRMTNGELVCKDLREVDIGTKRIPVSRKVDVDMAKEMAAVRARAGYPLERLDIVTWGTSWTGPSSILTKCVE